MTDAPRILALCGDENGCTLWRVFSPFAELQRRGYVAEWAHNSEAERVFPLVAAGRYDAVLLPRMSWDDPTAADAFFRAMHNANLAVIYEVDDDLYSPAIVRRQKATVQKGATLELLERQRQARIDVVRRADGVTVSSRRVQTIVRSYTDKPVVVVPNAIDGAYWRVERRRARRAVPPLTIGWSGGSRYDEDLVPVAEAWGRIARRYPAVRFVVQGFPSPSLSAAVPADRLHVLPWLPIDWQREPDGTLLPPYVHGLLNIDIGCCAVAPLPFNTAKTPIKWYELTLAGASCVVSPTLYGREVVDGETALVAETADEWEAALGRMVEDEVLRRRLRKAARWTVMRDHSLRVNWWRWPVAWAEIVADFRQR